MQNQPHLHRMFLVKFALSAQVSEQLTTWNVLHKEEQVARVLCEALETDLWKHSLQL